MLNLFLFKRNGGRVILLVLIFCLLTVLFQLSFVTLAFAATSGDAYTSYDSVNKIWTMGTSKVEKKVQLDGSGRFLFISFKNKISNREYIQGANQNSDEFHVKIGAAEYAGLTGGWVYDTYSENILSQGEIKLSITFHNNVVKVIRNYIIYPSTPVIQEWTVYQNVSGSSQNFSYPHIFRQRIMQNDVSNVDFYYMTGGGNFTGSNVLKSVALTTNYSREFNSFDSPEVMTVDVHNINISYYKVGATIYHQFYALRNRSEEDGILFLTFDYMGHWGVNIGNWSGNILVNGSAQILNMPVVNNDTLTTPKAMTGVFSGDIDDMGNTILDYVYRYKWDYTRDDYFAMVKPYMWVSGSQMPNAFHMLNNMRYIGADVMHIDDSWYSNKGDWNNVNGDDFSVINQYANKQGMVMTVWMPTWHVNLESRVAQEHPDWLVASDTNTYYGNHLDGGKIDVMNLGTSFTQQQAKRMGYLYVALRWAYGLAGLA